MPAIECADAATTATLRATTQVVGSVCEVVLWAMRAKTTDTMAKAPARNDRIGAVIGSKPVDAMETIVLLVSIGTLKAVQEF